MNDKPSLGRREFLRGGLRALALTAVAGVAALLGRRALTVKVPAAQQDCANRFICSSCSRRQDCILPQALSARQGGRAS